MKRVSTIHYIDAVERLVKHFVATYFIDFEKGHAELEWFLFMLIMVQWHLQKCTKKEHIKCFIEILMLYASNGNLKEAECNLRQVLTFLGSIAIRREADRLIPKKSTNFETRVATLLMNIANGQYILVKNASYIKPDQTPNLDEYTLEDIDVPNDDNK